MKHYSFYTVRKTFVFYGLKLHLQLRFTFTSPPVASASTILSKISISFLNIYLRFLMMLSFSAASLTACSSSAAAFSLAAFSSANFLQLLFLQWCYSLAASFSSRCFSYSAAFFAASYLFYCVLPVFPLFLSVPQY